MWLPTNHVNKKNLDETSVGHSHTRYACKCIMSVAYPAFNSLHNTLFHGLKCNNLVWQPPWMAIKLLLIAKFSIKGGDHYGKSMSILCFSGNLLKAVTSNSLHAAATKAFSSLSLFSLKFPSQWEDII